MSLDTPPFSPSSTPCADRPDDLLSVEISARDGVGLMVVAGEIDIATGPFLRESVRGLLAGGHRNILVDLDAVTFIDSTGIGILVAFYRAVAGQSGELGLVCNNRICRRLLDMAGLNRVFTFHESQDAAVAAMATPRP